MARKFTTSEVLDVAMKMERESEEFFRLGARSTADPEMKKIFNFLVNESRRQYTYFQLLKENEGTEEEAKHYAGDKDLYLETLAEESVLSDRKKAAFVIKKDKTDKDIIDFVREIKRAMIDFLGHIRKEVSVSGRNVIEKIITEETNHIKLMDKLEKSV